MSIQNINIPVNYTRQYAAPIDVDELFDTASARTAYLSSSRKWPGMLVADRENPGKRYILNAAGSGWDRLWTTADFDINDYVAKAGSTMSGALLMNATASLDSILTGGSDTLNIGTSNADVINIGWSGSVVNIMGTLLYQNVTNLAVKDKLIRLNVGGSTASGTSSGFEIEENATITGYFATNSTRNGWDFKAPASQQLTLLTSALTTSRTLTAPDQSGTIAVLTDLLGPAGGELAGNYPNPTLVNSAVIGKVLTGYSSAAGTVAATDTILQAIQKLNGNITTLYVPYIGANTAVNLNTQTLTAGIANFSGNTTTNSLIAGYATTATSGGTLTLTVASPMQQFFTGSSGHTVTLPVPSTLVLGQQFVIVNKSTQPVGVQASVGNSVTGLFAGWMGFYTCILTSGTTSASWSVVTIPLLTNPQNGYIPYSGANQGINLNNQNVLNMNGLTMQGTGGTTLVMRDSGDINGKVQMVMLNNGSTSPNEWLTFRFTQRTTGNPTIDTLVLDGSGKSTFNTAGIQLQDSTAQTLGIITAATMTTPWVWTFPDNPGVANGDVLATDASGTTRWQNLGSTYLKLDASNGPITGLLSIGTGTPVQTNLALQLFSSNASSSQTATMEINAIKSHSGNHIGLFMNAVSTHASGTTAQLQGINSCVGMTGAGTVTLITSYKTSAVLTAGSVGIYAGYFASAVTPAGTTLGAKYSFYVESGAGAAVMYDFLSVGIAGGPQSNAAIDVDRGDIFVRNGYGIGGSYGTTGASGGYTYWFMKPTSGGTPTGYIDFQGGYAGGTYTAPIVMQRQGGAVLIGSATATAGNEKLQVTGDISVTGFLALTSSSVLATGVTTFGYNSTQGTYITTKSGSVNQLQIVNNAGATILNSLAGTQNIGIAGDLAVVGNISAANFPGGGGGGTSGTYTPTLTNGSGFGSGLTLKVATYLNIANIVEVMVYVLATPTSGGGISFNITLPVARTGGSTDWAGGLVNSSQMASGGGYVYPNGSSTTVTAFIPIASTISTQFIVKFTYNLL